MRSSSPLFALAAAARNVAADDGDCECFMTNGTTPAFYSKHMFFDFRSLSDVAGVPDVIGNDSDGTAAGPSSDYFANDDWTSVWALQNWTNSKGKDKGFSNDATVLMINSASNVYIEKNGDEGAASDTYMTMRTSRLDDFQTAAEFQTQNSNYQFLSLRMLARTIGDDGAVTAMFTYRDSPDPKKVQEADIEILTRGPRDKVQYTNQPSYLDDEGEITASTRNASMPNDIYWTEWATYRLDWTPERSVWYVNGEEVASIAFQVPRDASGVNFNSWSDGGSWSGNMSAGGEASMQIQWIEMVYNTTDEDVQSQRRGLGPRGQLRRRDGGGGECGAVCSIDETEETGKATKLWEGAASRAMDGLGVWAYVAIMGMSIWVWGI